ncbi:MAG: recombinase family protein [Proteobacteria bacterium]|nr:recombinase family protein [Pseudomonadota bacterium]
MPLRAEQRRIGYARVSTDDQRMDLQRDALRVAGCATVYADTASGKDASRPELEHCRKALRQGDVLVVWRLDRLGRSLADLVQIVTELEQHGVGFESLTEKIDTTNASGKLIFHLFAALAEFERNLIRERTRAGLAAARARGRNGGRRRVLSPKDVQHIKVLVRDPSVTMRDITDRFGVGRATVYRALKRADVENSKGKAEGKGR